MRFPTLLRSNLALLLLAAVAGMLLVACGADTLSDADTPEAEPAGSGESRTLVLGNIDATNPAEKIAEFQPLVDYLVSHLEDFGDEAGEIVIAQDTGEMARMLENGDVDIYVDAAIPSLEVCSLVDCEFALRQWKGGEAELAGVFVTSKESDIESLDDLKGKVIMLEQPHSTVGHILPLAALAEQGIATRRVDDIGASVAEDEIGYVVATGGQSSMNLLLEGEIEALAIGERAFKRFSADVHEQVVIIDETVAAPSQLVTFRPGFDEDLEQEIRGLMISLEDNEY